jgi:hypothetical protein
MPNMSGKTKTTSLQNEEREETAWKGNIRIISFFERAAQENGEFLLVAV